MFILMSPRPPRSTLFPYTTLFRSLPLECATAAVLQRQPAPRCDLATRREVAARSEEHTSELQSRVDLVCRLLLEKKNGSGAQTNHTQAAALELPALGQGVIPMPGE